MTVSIGGATISGGITVGTLRVYNRIFNQTDVTQNWNFFRPRFGL
jgi:hypothetical protein